MNERFNESRDLDFGNGVALSLNPENFKIHGSVDVKRIFENKPIVLVGPHPDDPELSMGVMTSLLVEAGNEVRIVSATTGSEGVNNDYIFDRQGLVLDDKLLSSLKASVRIEEGRRAADLLGAQYYNLDIILPEAPYDNRQEHRYGHLRIFGEISKDDKKKIRLFISENMDAVWFLPYPFKSAPHHGVHERISLEFIRALAERDYQEDVWFYETRERRQLFYRDRISANVVVTFGKEQMDLKTSLVSLFDSQVSRDPKYYLDITQKRNARIARVQATGSEYAERFLRGRLDKF